MSWIALASVQTAAQFQVPREITAAIPAVEHAALADFDGDGRMDLLRAGTDDALAWHRNSASAQFFSPAQSVDAPTKRVRSVAASDIDGDGAADVVAASEGELTWFQQLGGGDFAPAAVIDGDCAWCTLVRNGAIDGVGLDDLVYVEGHSQTIYLRRNQGGTLGSRETVATLPSIIADLELADLDADGDLDLVVAAGGLYVIQNLGAAFAAPTQGFSFIPIIAVEVGALLGSALPDVLTLHRDTLGNGAVEVRRNLGSFNFEPPMELHAPISPVDIELADMDGDGDLDPGLWFVWLQFGALDPDRLRIPYRHHHLSTGQPQQQRRALGDLRDR